MFGEKVRGSVAWACAAVLGLGVAAGCATCECGAKAPAAHVFARIADSARYEALHPRFKKAFDFMRRSDLAQLPCGRYEIDGSNCWAMVMEARLKPFGEVNTYEVHRAYIDIQSPITGKETIGFTKPAPEVFAEFNVEKDYVLFKAKGEARTLAPGDFAVFFPGEGAHAPCLSCDGATAVRKLVIKVRH